MSQNAAAAGPHTRALTRREFLRAGAAATLAAGLQTRAAAQSPPFGLGLVTYNVARDWELDTVLRRGVERGELPADADLELARDLVIGPMIVRRVLGRMPRRRVREAAERLTDTVLAALRAPR